MALLAVGGGDFLLAALPLILGAGGLGAVLAARATNRRTDAEAVKTRAQAGDILQDTYAEAISDLRNQMAELRDDARGARAEAAEARAHAAGAREEAIKAQLAQQRAETRAAELEASLARAEQKAGEERHALRNDLAARTAEAALLSQRVNQLEAEVERLTAQLAQTERRHDRRRTEDP